MSCAFVIYVRLMPYDCIATFPVGSIGKVNSKKFFLVNFWAIESQDGFTPLFVPVKDFPIATLLAPSLKLIFCANPKGFK